MDFMLYILIFFAKIIEVSFMTVRIVFITKGERKLGAIIGFFEVILWIVIVSNVINNISSDPLKAISYALGFAVGNYVGSMVEEKIGIGLSEVKVILREDHGDEMASHIRSLGHAVTVLSGEGKNMKRNMLIMFIPRKKVKKLVASIVEKQENAVITVSEIKPVYGGYGMVRK
ncbi:MAG: DUF5698 domain-containing protein [Acidaminobacteraceae bacterium]